MLIMLTYKSAEDVKSIYEYDDGLILINETYHEISEFSYIKEFIIEYTSFKNKFSDISFYYCYQFYLIPIFCSYTLVSSFRFVAFKKDKLIYIFSEIVTLVIKSLSILDSFLYIKTGSKIPDLDNNRTYGEIGDRFDSYGEQTLKGGQGLVIFCLIIMIIEIIIFIILLLINKDDDIETDKIRDNMVQSITLYTIFVFSLFFMFDLYNIEECNTYYIHNFDTDYFLINRTYTIINETKIYFSRNRQIYGEDLYQYDTFIFDYDDYPILKDIYEIHEKNSWKIVSNQKVTNSDSNLYFIFRFYLASFLPFIAYIFLFIYKCKNKCKIIYCIFYILSILINIITFTFPLIIKNYEYKENLKSEDDNIKYIIDEYNNYAKCVNRFLWEKFL